MKIFIFFIKIFVINFFLTFNAYTEIISEIIIKGNERISNETVKLFSKIEPGNDINENDINLILKDLYQTNYFENISVSFLNNVLTIIVKEHPIIQSVEYNGVKSNKLIEAILKDKLIKDKSPYNENLLNFENDRLKEKFKELGYYNSSLETSVIKLDDNLVSLKFDIDLGDKAKIKKITFVGNKIFKDSKLKRLIASSEYKFWKIISRRKYLNENIVLLDERLLKNYYLNNGYYNAVVKSSFAKIVGDNEFELIFNIDAKDKVLFGELNLNIPDDFDKDNFDKIYKLFDKIKNEPYSINLINKILNLFTV